LRQRKSESQITSAKRKGESSDKTAVAGREGTFMERAREQPIQKTALNQRRRGGRLSSSQPREVRKV